MMLKAKIAILVENNYQELELWYPYYRLLEAGASCDLIGPEANKGYHSKLGYEARSNVDMKKVKAEDYDAVVIPGGYAPDRMRAHLPMVDFVREMNKHGKVIAAICHAGWMLASAEIIEGKTVTSYFAIKDDMKHAGAKYVDKPVVVDGNIITSRQPSDLPEFCKAIIEALS